MKAKLVSSALGVLLLGSLGGCATTGSESAPIGASARHEHMRDHKQGYAASYTPAAPARKPLHDHREFK